MFNIASLKLRKIIIGVLVVILFIVAWFFSTHGFIVVESLKNGEIISYSQTEEKLITNLFSSDKNRTFVSAGDYMVQVPSQDGGIYIKKISVPGFLSSITVSKPASLPKTDVIGRQTLVNLATKGGGVVSYSSDSHVLQVDSTNITGSLEKQYIDQQLSLFEQQVQISSSVIAGVIKVETGYQPVAYNLTTGDISYFPFIESTDKSVTISASQTAFTSFNKKVSTVTVYNPDKPDNTRTIVLESSQHVTNQNGTPIYSYENNVIATLTGDDFINRGDGESKTSNHSLLLLNISTKKQLKSIDLGDTPITNISLSQDTKHLYIQSQQSAIILNTSTGEQELALPFAINQFKWIDSNQFVFLAGQQGVFVGDISSKSAQTLIPYSIARPTSLSFVDKGSVYFTAYTAKTNGVDNPDAYRTVVSKPATDLSQKVLKTFPHQGDGYYVDYINGEITIQLTRYNSSVSSSYTDTAAEKRALEYVNGIFGNTKPPISYVYVDFDLY